MARLPQPGGDAGDWGVILNEFLSQAHANDGLLKSGIVPESALASSVQAKINAVAGPTGATGPVGATGSTGPIGATGAAGPQAVSTDGGNLLTLGTDSRVMLAAASLPGPKITVSSTAPASPSVGDVWIDTSA